MTASVEVADSVAAVVVVEYSLEVETGMTVLVVVPGVEMGMVGLMMLVMSWRISVLPMGLRILVENR